MDNSLRVHRNKDPVHKCETVEDNLPLHAKKYWNDMEKTKKFLFFCAFVSLPSSFLSLLWTYSFCSFGLNMFNRTVAGMNDTVRLVS